MEKIKCTFCKKLFEPSYNKHKERKYCSLDCVFKHRKSISKNIEITKQIVLKRARGKCEKCGRKGKLHVHHKKDAEYYPNGHSPKSGEQNNPKNLIALCIFCHRQIHSKGIKRFYKKGKCLHCKKEFYYYPKSNKGKFCSKICLNLSPKLGYIYKYYTCIICKSRFKAARHSKYCSECRTIGHKLKAKKWEYEHRRKKKDR
jgi:hypothetical protein